MTFKLLEFSTLGTHFKIQKIIIEVCAKRQIAARLPRFRFGLQDFRSGFRGFGSGFEVFGLGFNVWGLGSGVLGLGFEIVALDRRREF